MIANMSNVQKGSEVKFELGGEVSYTVTSGTTTTTEIKGAGGNTFWVTARNSTPVAVVRPPVPPEPPIGAVVMTAGGDYFAAYERTNEGWHTGSKYSRYVTWKELHEHHPEGLTRVFPDPVEGLPPLGVGGLRTFGNVRLGRTEEAFTFFDPRTGAQVALPSASARRLALRIIASTGGL